MILFGSSLKHAIKRLIPNCRKDVSYQIGRFKLTLPYGHMLPTYQEGCPQYDRFLPHLAKYLPVGSYVVDVGANCADTLAGIIDANPSLNFLCVEADDFFYRYLSANVDIIKKILPEPQIMTVNCLAGSEVSGVVMIGSGGTKRAFVAHGLREATIQSVPLDRIVDSEKIPYSAVSLIKVDTDGYDYDVISSARLLLNHRLPLLYFECQYDDESQKAKYQRLIVELVGTGYTNWAVFDNYGALLLKACSSDNILDLIEYVWRQNIGNSYRTIYYFDILAGSVKDGGVMGSALNDY